MLNCKLMHAPLPPVAAALVLASAGLAQDLPKVMTKIIVQADGRSIPQGATLRQPRVIYRAGAGYCRVEESVEEGSGLQELLIIREPDVWVVNLSDRKGRHSLDPGPVLDCHLPIFSGPPPGSADKTDYLRLGLEFGGELAFFRKMGAVAQTGPVLQSKETTSYILEREGTRLALFTYGPDQHPLLLARTTARSEELYWYSGYGQLPFDADLFTVPRGIDIVEQR